MRFGEWEGLNWDEVSKRDAAYAERWMAEYPWLPAPGGEDFSSFRKRVQEALAEMAAQDCGRMCSGGDPWRRYSDFSAGCSQVAGECTGALTCEYASCLELQLRAGRWRQMSGNALQDMQTKSHRGVVSVDLSCRWRYKPLHLAKGRR